MANAPLVGQDGGIFRVESTDGESGIFFQADLDDPNRLESLQKIRFFAHGFFSAIAAAELTDYH
jgi:hypothetical protein